MNKPTLQLIVGLGNPDKNLLGTRHNVGFWFIDTLSEKFNKDLILSKKFEAEIFNIEKNGESINFMKPLSYINNSGVPIKKFIKNTNIETDNILIVYDDIDLIVGKIRLKLGGSSGGHKGLDSIIEQLGSKEFWRLRIGIGKPAHKDDTNNYVLGKPSKEDKEKITKSIDFSITNCDDFSNIDFSKLMNVLNGDNS
ncbi:MAG: aminoacyl-tRNA hydrolase [Pseudomonadota bacterium]|nr:aminoacyl-tRNA hydrolase [Pseudomonadota bacterium]|tara:strand:+ start:89 stop:676 length:588 start_codon:yes stop_codon:yes gene_type:complete